MTDIFEVYSKDDIDGKFNDLATPENISNINAQLADIMIDIRNYNGFDSTGNNDSTSAFKSAIADVKANKGSVLLIPDGVFATDELTIDSDSFGIRSTRKTTLKPIKANQYLIRMAASNCYIEGGLTIDNPSNLGGVLGLALVPVNETQTTTVTNQNYNRIMGLWIKNISEGIRMASGPNVAGTDSGLWYNEFYNTHIQYTTTGVNMKTGLSSGANRNKFFGLRMGQTGMNTGLLIESGGQNEFYGIACEGISTGSNPTGIVIGSSSSDGNKFFGAEFEGNTIDVNNGGNYTEFHGHSIGLNKLRGNLPKYMLGYDPSSAPLVLPGLIYSEGSWTNGVQEQGSWEFSKPINPTNGVSAETIKTPTFLNGWTNYDTGADSQAGYWKDPFGVVHLQGTVKGGTIGSLVFQLPSGYIPAGQQHFAVDSNNAHGVCRIGTSGEVIADVGVNTRFSLNGITFRAGS